MRKMRDVLRLSAAGMSSRKIVASVSIGGTTVVDCLRRARETGERLFVDYAGTTMDVMDG